jgi:hypothetical protein
MNAPVSMNVAEMKRAASLGALIEFVGGGAAASRLDQFADAIRQVDPQFCVLASDLGRRGNPAPADGFATFLGEMRARGFSNEEIVTMSRVNPARLLGLRTAD